MNTTALGRVIPFPQPSKSAKLKRGRPTDAAQGRTRSSLTPGEVGKLIKAARSTGRYGHRDATLILLAYRHGLRVSELIAMRWDQVDFHQGLLAVVRRERGVPSMHPLSGTELRALRRLKREQPRPESRHGFQTDRGGPLSASTVRHVVRRARKLAGIPFSVQPHRLRHSTGYKLANAGTDTRALQHYLGHRNIQHMVRYTELAHGRFNGLWVD